MNPAFGAKPTTTGFGFGGGGIGGQGNVANVGTAFGGGNAGGAGGMYGSGNISTFGASNKVTGASGVPFRAVQV